MLLFFFNFKNKLLGNPEGSPWMLAHPGWETLPSLHGWVTAPASFPLPSPLLFLYLKEWGKTPPLSRTLWNQRKRACARMVCRRPRHQLRGSQPPLRRRNHMEKNNTRETRDTAHLYHKRRFQLRRYPNPSKIQTGVRRGPTQRNWR